MIFIQYLVLAIVQGITEPLPISSSGHMILFDRLIGSNFSLDSSFLNFTIITNFGSLLAILFLFRKKIWCVIKDFFGFIASKDSNKKDNFRYGLMIIIGSIPAGIVGFLFKDHIDKIFSNQKIIGIALIITGIFLFLIKDFKGKKNDNMITCKDSIVVGFFQMIALIPGISRSGSTIVGGMLKGFKRETALEYSFMLYIPVSLASTVLGIKDFLASPNLNELIFPYFIGFVVAGVITYFSAKLFIDLVKKGKLIYFVYYCFIVGILATILL